MVICIISIIVFLFILFGSITYLANEQFNGDEIFIKVSHVEAVERLRSSYDGRPAGSTAYHKEICKVHTYGGKTFGVKESYKYVMDTIDFLSHLS